VNTQQIIKDALRGLDLHANVFHVNLYTFFKFTNSTLNKFSVYLFVFIFDIKYLFIRSHIVLFLVLIHLAEITVKEALLAAR